MQENDNTSSQSSTIGGLIGLVIIIVIGVWVYNNLFKGDDYSKPWWEGSAVQQVCPTFDDGEQCYYLTVVSDGEQVTGVNFKNGGYLYGSSECHKAAEDLYDYDRFCRFWDQENRKWDISPNLAAYPEYKQ